MATKVKRKIKPRQRGAVLSDVVNDYVNNTIMAKRLEWIEQSRFITMDIVTIALGRMGFRASYVGSKGKNRQRNETLCRGGTFRAL